MIKFIIVDDNDKFLKKLNNLISKCMMKSDVEYEVVKFKEYDKNFERLARDESCLKVYLLDIETEEGSGIDAARFIRESVKDWLSIIIIVSSHTEYKYEAFSNRLFLLDFISKLNDFENTLKDDIARSLIIYNDRKKSLTFDSKTEVNSIDYDSIIMINKLKDSKQSVVRSVMGDQIITQNISDLAKLLDVRFIQTSRSTIINRDYIQSFDKVRNIITFTNGTSTNDVSRRFRKDVIDRVTSNI